MQPIINIKPQAYEVELVGKARIQLIGAETETEARDQALEMIQVRDEFTRWEVEKISELKDRSENSGQ